MANKIMIMSDGMTALLRRNFPYGLIEDMDGKVIFFNREYQAMTFGGKKEFDIKPEDLGIEFPYVAEGKFLLTEEDDAYVGKMYFLYDMKDIPYYLSYEDFEPYMMRIAPVLNAIVGTLANPYAERNCPKTLCEKQSRRMRKLYNKRFHKHICK